MRKHLLAVIICTLAIALSSSVCAQTHTAATQYGACTEKITGLLEGGGHAFVATDVLAHPNPGFTSYLLAFKSPQLQGASGHVEVQYFSKSRMRSEIARIRDGGAWFVVGARHALPEVKEKELPDTIVDETNTSRTTIWFGKILVPGGAEQCTDLYTFEGLFDDNSDDMPENVWAVIRPTLRRGS